MGEQLEISLKASVFNDLSVSISIESLAKYYIVLDGVVDDPWLLGHQSHSTFHVNSWLGHVLFVLHLT